VSRGTGRSAESSRRASKPASRRKSRANGPALDPDLARVRAELSVQHTELEMQNEELRSSRAALETALGEYTQLFEFAPTGVFVVTSDSGIRAVNFAGARLLGLERARLCRLRLAPFVSPKDGPRFARLLADAFSSEAGGPGPAVCELTLGSGSAVREVRVTASRLVTVTDESPKTLLAVEDITAHRQAERAARENLAQVAHMNRIGIIGELTGSFAHELNTPLAAALNNAQAALRFLRQTPPASDEVAACLEDIVGDIRRAGEVIQRMRRILRRGEAQPVKVDISALIHDAVRLVDAEARDHNVALSVEVAPAVPRLVADDVQLVQVLLNLLNNALDALTSVPQDRRRISVRAAPARDGVELLVSDSGPGIPQSQLEKVFEPFYTTKTGGLGLGLAISRSIVEAHGGRMDASTREGQGTVFRVFLPARLDGELTAPPSSPPDPPAPRPGAPGR
jgi:PAS domain S-box-containing protein